MPSGRLAPITPAVLEWAIQESGYTFVEIAAAVGIEVQTLAEWVRGSEQPNLTQFRKLARKLYRQPSVLLLPRPPISRTPALRFRRAPQETRTDLNPIERRYVREAGRIQRLVAWVAAKTEIAAAALRQVSIDSDAEKVGLTTRRDLGITIQEQLTWRSPSAALARWRGAIESQGILVFMLPLGANSCRGFSVWESRAPLISLNTHWNAESRIFTLFHELGHLLTRTNSACLEAVPSGSPTDPIERWCETYAAAVLLPWNNVQQVLAEEMDWTPGTKVRSLSSVSRLARRFRVSLRAAALSLIKHDAANWDLYRILPRASDKPRGGGGMGRTRREARLDQFGHRTFDTLLAGVQRDVLSPHDLASYLDIADVDVDVSPSN